MRRMYKRMLMIRCMHRLKDECCAVLQAEMQKQVAIERALAEGRARATEHRENRDIFMEEIGKSANEWGKQYMLLLTESFRNIGTGAQLLLTSEYGVNAIYGASALFLAYYGIRGGLSVAFGFVAPSLQSECLLIYMPRVFSTKFVYIQAFTPYPQGTLFLHRHKVATTNT